MTDDELRTLVVSNAEATRELRATVERQAQQSENQGHTIAEGLASLQASSESQLRSIESMRESISYNTDMVASSLELAAEALKISANTSRNLDRLESDIADLKQIVGIVIRDNQADRVRFSRLEGQN
jgi:HPt (histidine-containing phosphotransfer) domain-containing protein